MESNATITKPEDSTKWLGLDSTQILIIFLVIVFVVLVLFLLIYYFVIKGMKQRASVSQGRLAQKSTSGSTDGEKQRNIFAHPERQLAVDQSTRRTSPGQESDHSTKESQREIPKESQRETPKESLRENQKEKENATTEHKVNPGIADILGNIRDTFKETGSK